MNRSMTLCVTLLVAASTMAAAGDIDLIREGKPAAMLAPTSREQAAAQRLTAMLKQITGADLAASSDGVKLYVGPKAAKAAGVDLQSLQLGEEGFVILADRNRVVIAGLNDRSTDYAVSTFLERQGGVRWFWPHKLGTVVPQRKTINVPAGQRVERPAFAIRWIGDDADWSRHNKLNVVRNADVGLHIKWFVHTWLYLVPPEKYARTHPEYYALLKGKRESPSFERRTQLCTSNPEVADAAAATILELAEKDPSIRIVSIDPMDSARMCECDRCKALDEEGATGGRRHSRRVVLFYRDVARRVAKVRPDLKLKGIVYWSYVLPPRDTTIRLPDNMILQLCRFECHNHGLDDPTCPFNRTHVESLDGWQRICRSMFLYEYYRKVSWLDAPWPILHTLKCDLPYAHRRGLLGVASQHADNFGSHGVGYYVAAKLLWDPTLDVEALCKDYYLGLFGPKAGPELLAYWQTLERAAIDSRVHIALQRPYRERMALFTPELLAALESHLARAERLAETDEIARRIRLVRIAHDHCAAMMDYFREADAAVKANNSRKLTLEQLASLQSKADALDRYIARHQNEGALSRRSSYTDALLNPEQVARVLFQHKDPSR